MKTYALVCDKYSGIFSVRPYTDWLDYPSGCVMNSSDNFEELEREADWNNEHMVDDYYDDYESL